MSSYGFGFRASTRRVESEGKLYLRVSHGGDSRSVTTPYSVLPGEWDAQRRCLRIPPSPGPRAAQLADYQMAMQCDLERVATIVHELERRGGFTVDQLASRLRAVMAGNTFGAFAEQLAADLERQRYERTARAYRSAARRFVQFLGGHDPKLEEITTGLVGEFQQRLKAEGRNMNTISFYMRTLRAIYNKALDEGRVARRAESPFARVYTGVAPTRKRALSSVELAQLSAFDPTASSGEALLNESLQQALAMFLFCYHARGMCFVDLAHLKKSDLRGQTIRYRRRKTGQQIELAVHPAMRRILDWFASRTRGSEYLFPVITDPRRSARTQYENGLRLQNRRLRAVAACLGVGSRFSTHSARHSWATVARNEGLPLAVISEGLGHTSQRTTEIYLASLEQPVLDRASRLVSDALSLGRLARENERFRELEFYGLSPGGGYFHPARVW